MMEEDATSPPWGTHSEIGYHGGKVKVARPRVRDRAGKEVSLESWQALRSLNLMVLNVSTRKYHRAVRLPEGDLAKALATAPRSRPFPGALWRCHARR